MQKILIILSFLLCGQNNLIQSAAAPVRPKPEDKKIKEFDKLFFKIKIDPRFSKFIIPGSFKVSIMDTEVNPLTEINPLLVFRIDNFIDEIILPVVGKTFNISFILKIAADVTTTPNKTLEIPITPGTLYTFYDIESNPCREGDREDPQAGLCIHTEKY